MAVKGKGSRQVRKKCVKDTAYPCKFACILKTKNCKNPLRDQAKTFVEWMELQEKRLAIVNQKRSRAGLSEARLDAVGYIVADKPTKKAIAEPKARDSKTVLAEMEANAKESDRLHEELQQIRQKQEKEESKWVAMGKAPSVATGKNRKATQKEFKATGRSEVPEYKPAYSRAEINKQKNLADSLLDEYRKKQTEWFESKQKDGSLREEYDNLSRREMLAGITQKGDQSSKPKPNAGEQLKYNELTKLRHNALLQMTKSRSPKAAKEKYEKIQAELAELEKQFPGIKHTITQTDREKAQWAKTESDGLKALADYQKQGDRQPAKPVEDKWLSYTQTAKKELPQGTKGKIDRSPATVYGDYAIASDPNGGWRVNHGAFQVATGLRNKEDAQALVHSMIKTFKGKTFDQIAQDSDLPSGKVYRDWTDTTDKLTKAIQDRDIDRLNAIAKSYTPPSKLQTETTGQGDRESVEAKKEQITIDPKYLKPLKGAEKVSAGKAWNRRIDQQQLEMKKIEKEKQMEFLEENIRTGEKESVVRYPLTYGDNFGIVKSELGDWNVINLNTKKVVTSYPTKLDSQRFIASVLGEIGDKSTQQMSAQERSILSGIANGITGLAKLRKSHGNPNMVRLEVPPYIRQKIGENTPSLPIGKPVTPSTRPTTSSSEIKSFKHTKYGHELFAVNPPSDPTPREKQEFASKAKSMGGRYSSYDKEGAIAGYLFRDKKKAEQFRDWMSDKQQTPSQTRRTPAQTTGTKPTEQVDRGSVTPEPVKEKRPHPSTMSIADKIKELKEHYELTSPMPVGFRKSTTSGRYFAHDQGGMTYGQGYETEADAIKAYEESRKKKAENSADAMRNKSEKDIDRQVEYWRKERGIETEDDKRGISVTSSTKQPTAKEFGDRLALTPDDFKDGPTQYLGVAPNDGDGWSYRDKEWLKSKHGAVSYGNEYRVAKNGDYIAIESRPIAYKKDGDPIDDRINEGNWNSQYTRQNIAWNQDSTIHKIADFGITEKQHPLVVNAIADKAKRDEAAKQRDKELRSMQDELKEQLTAWQAIKQDAIAALPKPKKGQSVSYKGTDNETYTGKADLYGDNYAILKTDGRKEFSVADVKSGYMQYAGGLTATEAKELLGMIWRERGDKPVMKPDGEIDVPDGLGELAQHFKVGRKNSIPQRYAKEAEDRANSVKSEKSKAMQSNLFGGLDEIPVDAEREKAIADRATKEADNQYKKLASAKTSTQRYNASQGIGLTPTTKAFIADQLFKLNAFEFPDTEGEAPMMTIRTPGGTGQYEIPRTKGAITIFMNGIGIAPKKGETIFDALKRNAEGVKDFSEPMVSSIDQKLIQLAAIKASRLNFSEVQQNRDRIRSTIQRLKSYDTRRKGITARR